MTPAASRRAAARQAVEDVLASAGLAASPELRDTVARTVLAAIAPHTEHCVHDVAVHRAHHDQPAPGCPWCAKTAPGARPDALSDVTDLPRGELL
jgi:DNA-binding helix-hairpin-helix protein with protein kinase domain